MNRKAHVAFNFNCVVETEGLLKVTGSHVHCACSNISETVQDKDVVTTDHQCEMIYIAYQIAAIPVTFSDLHGHSPVVILLK